MNQGVSEVEKGSSLIDTAGAVFEEISAAVEVISDQVREVSAATEQMSASSAEVSASMQEVANPQNSFGSTQSISAASEEQLASMEEISRIKPCLKAKWPRSFRKPCLNLKYDEKTYQILAEHKVSCSNSSKKSGPSPAGFFLFCLSAPHQSLCNLAVSPLLGKRQRRLSIIRPGL
ncbi:hypothetical protein P7H16_06545 [Paenibacillus larvae]|nr:hypothetical protein [Paenibacillus larvae]MDT2246682.1 hypothetical protein [Paenibacillus larvae]